MWENWDEFAAALGGQYGEEEQEAALSFAEESGLLQQWAADEDAETNSTYDAALEKEFERVEAQVGRRLTETEEQAMLDGISTHERSQGFVPDFTAEYGPQLANARETEQGRVHLGASAAEEVFRQQAAEQPSSFGAPEPAGGGGRFADEDQ
jgi:hypothetical protein